jgi:hypothetical protein
MSNPYIQTSGGLTIDLLFPDPDDLHLPVMAHALAHLNRYTGHLGRYSVAEHLVLGAECLRDQGHGRGIQAGYLMHDAHESTTGDVSKPVKDALFALGMDFSIFEDPHQDAVERRFRVNTRAREVKDMDMAMCKAEALQGFGTLQGRGGRDGWPTCEPAPIRIRRWAADRAEREFLDWCARLDIV